MTPEPTPADSIDPLALMTIDIAEAESGSDEVKVSLKFHRKMNTRDSTKVLATAVQGLIAAGGKLYSAAGIDATEFYAYCLGDELIAEIRAMPEAT